MRYDNTVKFSVTPSHKIVTEVFSKGPLFRGYTAPCYEQGGRIYFTVHLNQHTMDKGAEVPEAVHFYIVPDESLQVLRLFANLVE